MAGIRTQQQLFGFGFKSQPNISTANNASELIRLSKLNPDLLFPELTTEDDSAEMGKGDEFATQEFAVSWDTKATMKKYLTSQIAMWAYTFGLGRYSAANGYTSTITPLDTTQGNLELPYFSVLQQYNPTESGGSPVDQLIYGCAIEGFQIDINNGPGRQASQISIDMQGCGGFVAPSGLTMPSVSTEAEMYASSASVVINGIDYVNGAARGNLKSLRLGVKNNLMASDGFFIGSGFQNAGQQQSGAIRGRLEIGNRVYSLSMVVRLSANSPEFTALRNLTTGTAQVGLSAGANDLLTVSHPKMSFKSVVLSNANNIAELSIDCTVMKDPVTGTPISVQAQNSTISGIGSAG